MKKKEMIIKIVMIMAILFTICIITMPRVSALTPDDIKASSTVEGSSEVQSLGQKLVGILQTAGVVVAVVILLVLGIKYMMGSAEEKSEYKKSMLPYLIGALVLFGASTIANVVYQFATNI